MCDSVAGPLFVEYISTKMSFALTYPNILSVTLDPAAEYIK